MIQDIGEHTFDNQYHPCPPDRESYALYYEDHAALVRKYPDRIEFPKFRDIERLNEDIYEDAVYLFSIDGERYYLVEEINRERQSHFTMENTEISGMQSHSTLHLPGLRDISFITGIRAGGFVENVAGE